MPDLAPRLKTIGLLMLGLLGLVTLGLWVPGWLIFYTMVTAVTVLGLLEWLYCARAPMGAIGSMVILLGGVSFGVVFHTQGFLACVYIGLLSAMSDTSAYLGGSMLKGEKLCPTISPNKTISGAVVGLFSVVLVGSLFYQWAWYEPWWKGLIISSVLGIVAQMGDLCSSWAKRACGIKEAGWVLPGHGGIVDRFDSWIAISIVVALVGLLGFDMVPASFV